MSDPQFPTRTLEELINEVKLYQPPRLLSGTRSWSDRLDEYMDEHGNQPLIVDLPKHLSYQGRAQTIAVTHHFLAMIAKLSLLNGHSLAPGTVSEDHYLRILRMATELYDPTDKDEPEKIIFREISKQTPYQESTWEPIPRALLLYLDANSAIEEPDFVIDAEFKKHFGLDVRAFMTLGFLLYAQFLTERAFYPLVGWKSDIPEFKDLLIPENVARLLPLVSTDQNGFKAASSEMAVSGAGNDQYDWNAFFKYPVIDIGSGNHLLPIPRLLIYRLHDAPFHELADIHAGEGADNSFRAFFGEVFQAYVGLLLEEAFPSVAYAEAGGSPSVGPVDWLLRVRDTAILIECRTSDFAMTTKSTGEPERIEKDLDRIARETIGKLPAKRAYLEEHADDFGLADVTTWQYLVVVRKALLPGPLVRAKIDENLSTSVPYHLLSIGDFEQLLALEDDTGIDTVLAEKAASNEEMAKDFRTFFHEKRAAYHFRRNPLLQRTFDSYFQSLGVEPED